MFHILNSSCTNADTFYVMRSLFFVGGALLGTAIGAGLELKGYDRTTCIASVVAAQLAYILTGLLVPDLLKHRRALKNEAAR